MSDSLNQVTKYLKNVKKEADLGLKRPRVPLKTSERIRDVFDADNPFIGKFDVPRNVGTVTLDLNFGQRLAPRGCCGDCFCGLTEVFTSEAAVNDSVYVSTEYVPNSTVVYIDGLRATKNTDYVESSPENKQVTVLLNEWSTIVISYVYSTENCTGSDDPVCADTLDCMPYGYYTGLTTVFADRFDRPRITQTTGGCGAWISGANDDNGIFTYTLEEVGNQGSGSASGSSIKISPGGINVLSGSQWEILVLSYAPSSISVSPSLSNDANEVIGASLTFVDTPGPQLTNFLRLTSSAYVYEEDEINRPNFRSSTQITVTGTEEIPWSMTRRSFTRLVQTEFGLGVRVWFEDEPEPSGFNLTLSVADANQVAGRTYEIVLPTMHLVTVPNSIVAIKIGASLNAGDYGVATTGYSWTGETCFENPDGKIRFQHCAVETSTVDQNSAEIPGAQMFWSFSHFDSGLPGALRVYNERITAWNIVSGGSPMLRVRGNVRVSEYNPAFIVPVQIRQYNLGESEPSWFGANGFGGGNLIESLSIPTDGQIHETEFLISGTAGQVQFGIGIAGPDGIAQSLPFKSGPFLFPNNHGIGVVLEDVRIEAVATAVCSANDYCGDCLANRCPKVVDTFTDTFDSGYASPTLEYDRQITSGSLTIDQRRDTRINVHDGQLDFSTRASTGIVGRWADLYYGSIFDCVSINYAGDYLQEGGGEATFDVKFLTLNMDGDNYSEMMVYGSASGDPDLVFVISNGEFSYETFSDIGDPNTLLPILSPDTWYTVKIQSYYDGQHNFKVKIWPADSNEPGWQLQADPGVTFIGFAMEFFNDDNVTNQVWSIRNLSITRIGFDSLVENDGDFGEGTGGTNNPPVGGSPDQTPGGPTDPDPTDPTPPPPPPPTSPPTGGNEIFPGTGTLRTAIINAPSGTSLILRGGSHVINTNSTSGITVNKPLNLYAYPGETPVITWTSSARQNGPYFSSGPNIISGITFQAGSGVFTDSMGSALAESEGGHHHIYENCTFIGHPNLGEKQQMLYLRYGTNITVRNCLFISNGSDGFGVHNYPGLSGYSASNVVVENCEFRGFESTGGGITTDWPITVRNCIFRDSYRCIQLRNFADGSIITGNRGYNVTIGIENPSKAAVNSDNIFN